MSLLIDTARHFKHRVDRLVEYWSLPSHAKRTHEARTNRVNFPDPGIEAAVRGACSWLCLAQDHSKTRDGGVARHYSLVSGWSSSYPETTGYIVPTMLDAARHFGEPSYRERARRMLDWLVSIQFPDGGFQGGMVDETPIVPVTFNTGQILIGLAAGVREFGRTTYLESLRKAADWLCDTQDQDGCWRKHATPFARLGEKAYETHVAWGLFEASMAADEPRYAESAARNCLWALTHQRENGWFSQCCLVDPSAPLTHTIGYVLRGVLEAYLHTRDGRFLTATRKTADGLLSVLRDDGFLAGRFRTDWSAAVRWACLTGSVQIAYCWLRLAEITGERKYREAGKRANGYVRRTVELSHMIPETRGAISGSYPRHGAYGRYEYLNWAAKFFIDSNLAEVRATIVR